MNQIASINNSLTMSSREIANVVSSRHSDICVSIQRLIAKEVIAGYEAMPYTHEQNLQLQHFQAITSASH